MTYYLPFSMSVTILGTAAWLRQIKLLIRSQMQADKPLRALSRKGCHQGRNTSPPGSYIKPESAGSPDLLYNTGNFQKPAVSLGSHESAPHCRPSVSGCFPILRHSSSDQPFLSKFTLRLQESQRYTKTGDNVEIL